MCALPVLLPEFAKDIGDKDAADLHPHIIAILTVRLGDEMVRDPGGVGGMCDLGKGRPEGAPVIERIEDDVAARRLIIVRDELAAGGDRKSTRLNSSQ